VDPEVWRREAFVVNRFVAFRSESHFCSSLFISISNLGNAMFEVFDIVK
jgi:hypothetical protein